MNIPAIPPSLIYFVFLSGGGWCLDLSVLVLLVGKLGLPVFLGNLISASLAAGLVFLISSRMIFRGERTYLASRLGVYLIYTFAVIIVAASLIALLVGFMQTLAGDNGFDVSYPTLAIVAKILVTPPQLLLNFFVARYTSLKIVGT